MMTNNSSSNSDSHFSPCGRFYFDAKAAQKAIGFFPRYLRHIKGEWAGQPVNLSDWQREKIIGPTFGWKRVVQGLSKKNWPRRYTTVYIEVPKKNGKSTIAAGIGLYLLHADNEPGAEVYSAAGDRDQAAIVFEAASEMNKSAHALERRSRTYRRSIYVPKTKSIYKVLSADAPTKHGFNNHGIIFDELHTQPNRHLWDTLTTGTAARRQPLVFAITTAGFDRNSICWEMHEHSRKILEGLIRDDSFLPVIYAASKEDDWTEPKTWEKANPGFGLTVKEEYLVAECKRAQVIPGRQNAFKRLHLNIWTEQETRWLPMEKWRACGFPVDAETLRGKPCFAGLDLATTSDLAALILVFPGERPHALSFFWCPEGGIEKRSQAGVPYSLWRDQGFIESTPGNVTDYDIIRKRINELGEKYEIKEIAIDRWNSTQLQTQLMGDGFNVIQFGQGFASMTAPSKELEKLVLSQGIAHGNNPVLNWMASNVSVEQDAAGNLKPSKKSSAEKIDGIVALIMALGRMMVSDTGGSVYEERGILVL